MAQDPEGPPPDPPAWGGAGVPSPVHDGPTKVDGYRTIPVHDERAFMEECANRLNAFIHTHPDEAQHVLSTFVKYDHELVDVYRHLNRDKPHRLDATPGATVAALFGAVLQTHRGNGFFLRPVLLPDPDQGPGCTRIVKFLIVEQDEQDPQGPTA